MKMKNEIVIREEVRPAVYTFRDSVKSEWEKIAVLVHTTKTGKHGGHILEDEEGMLFEAILDTNHIIRFSDGMLKEYAFEVVSE